MTLKTSLLLASTFFIYCSQVYAQTNALIFSGENIKRAQTFYDSSKYDLAIEELRQIDPRDTNYVSSLLLLSKVYLEKKNYDASIKAAMKGLEKPSNIRASLFFTYAQSTSAKGNIQQALSIIDSATQIYPFNFSLPYLKGLVYYDLNQPDSAERQFFKTLDLNPYHSRAHLYLSRIAMRRDQKVRGMLSMGIYLALNNGENAQVVNLENFVKNELKIDNPFPADTNPFERLDEIIRAKLAMEKDYKTTIPIDLGIVSQYQLLFEQINSQLLPADDPWQKYYINIYQDLIKEKLQDAFIYHILNSTPIKEVARWKEKNAKTLTKFYDITNAALSKNRSIKTLPKKWGYSTSITCSYSKTNTIKSIGATDNTEKKTGKWYYYEPNGEISAVGNYKQDVKIGNWNYFEENGLISSIENYDAGEVTIFNTDGKKIKHYFYKGKMLVDDFEFFYPCGVLKEKRNYVNGKKEGLCKNFFSNGKIKTEFSYKADSLDGKFTTWYLNGLKHEEENHDNGKNIGKYTSWSPNGKISVTGNFDNGDATGSWVYYHSNGKVHYNGIYKKGQATGIWEYYDVQGELTEKRSFNDKGIYDGESMYFEHGKLHYNKKYTNGVGISSTYFSEDGKVIATYENSEGSFEGKGFFLTGEVQSEFKYLKGMREGKWKFYFRSGQLESEYNYKNDKLEGQGLQYYENGPLKSRSDYVNGELNGLYREYFLHGGIKQEGWYVNGKMQQKWNTFHTDGSLATDIYYLNGNSVGYILNFIGDGKLFTRVLLNDDGITTKVIHYRYDSTIIPCVEKITGTQIEFDYAYKNGNVNYHSGRNCGSWNGTEAVFFPDGNPYFQRTILDGNLEGEYKGYNTDNMLDAQGNYLNDEKSGKWSWYSNGKLNSEGKYLNDKKDSVWTYFHYNGVVSNTGNFINDERNGVTQYFGMNGQLVLYKQFADGDLIAFRTQENGKFSEWMPFKGTGTITTHYQNGNLAIEETYSKGEYDNKKTIFFPDGKPASIYQYHNSEADGPCFAYYPDGKIRIKMIYKNDLAFSKWEYFEPNGKLTKTESFLNGVLDGPVEFYIDGKKIREQKFWGGNPVD